MTYKGYSARAEYSAEDGVFFGRLLVRFLAEAVVRAALFAQELGVFSEEIPPLRLDIRTHGTADIGTFVVG